MAPDSPPETAGVKPTEKLPTEDPGPPPKKKRLGGRAYQKAKAEREAAEIREAEEARRAEQGPLAAKLLTPIWSWGFRVTGGILKQDFWALTEDESEKLGAGSAGILVKYLDLDILLKFKEEIAFGYLLARIVGPRLAKANEEAARADAESRGDDSRSLGGGEKPPSQDLPT